MVDWGQHILDRPSNFLLPLCLTNHQLTFSADQAHIVIFSEDMSS